MSSGQVVTNLTVGGSYNFELAKEDAVDLFFKSAMYNTWVTTAPVTVGLTIAATASTLTRDAGDWNSEVRVGDFLQLTGFTTTANNTEVMVSAINSATELKIVGVDLVDDATGTDFQLADYLEIGITPTSFTVEKSFEDLTEKAVNYRGQLVSEFNLDVSHGSIINGSFTFMGNDYEPVDAAADWVTNGRTVTAPATTNFLNGSVDMPFVASDANSADMSIADFCINGVTLALTNNLFARNCIGLAAPKSYGEGQAGITVGINTYLGNTNWSMISKKLSQEPFAIAFILKNAGGFYAFYLPAVQVSFDDPASGGQNSDVMLDMSGVAKVGSNGESALRIFRS